MKIKQKHDQLTNLFIIFSIFISVTFWVGFFTGYMKTKFVDTTLVIKDNIGNIEIMEELSSGEMNPVVKIKKEHEFWESISIPIRVECR